jgi:hypothetical protein
MNKKIAASRERAAAAKIALQKQNRRLLLVAGLLRFGRLGGRLRSARRRYGGLLFDLRLITTSDEADRNYTQCQYGSENTFHFSIP